MKGIGAALLRLLGAGRLHVEENDLDWQETVQQQKLVKLEQDAARVRKQLEQEDSALLVLRMQARIITRRRNRSRKE